MVKNAISVSPATTVTAPKMMKNRPSASSASGQDSCERLAAAASLLPKQVHHTFRLRVVEHSDAVKDPYYAKCDPHGSGEDLYVSRPNYDSDMQIQGQQCEYR